MYQPVLSSVDAMCAAADLSKLSGNIQGIKAELHVVDGTCVTAESSKSSGNTQSVNYCIADITNKNSSFFCKLVVNAADVESLVPRVHYIQQV